MTVTKIAVLALALLALIDAAMLVTKRRGDHAAYGGRLAFTVHLGTVTAFAASLVVIAVVSDAPVLPLALLLVVIGLLDAVIGVLARRRRGTWNARP